MPLAHMESAHSCLIKSSASTGPDPGFSVQGSQGFTRFCCGSLGHGRFRCCAVVGKDRFPLPASRCPKKIRRVLLQVAGSGRREANPMVTKKDSRFDTDFSGWLAGPFGDSFSQ